ncbi:MAG: sigma 54-interacting transcriptional regulator [Acidobacteriota bacterium]
MLFRLVILDGGPEAGRESSHTLAAGETVVGSGEGCGVRLGHPAVSRRHASFNVDGDGVTLEDLGSSNGTFEGGRRVVGTVALTPPAELAFGPVSARLEPLDPGDAEPARVLLGADGPDPDSGTGGTATTIQSASLQRLWTAGLPSWIDALEEGLGAVTVAQRVGASLVETLPLVSLVLRRPHTEGELFRAGPGKHDGVDDDDGETDVEGGRIDVAGRTVHAVARFAHPVQARAYRPVVESGVRVVDLASRTPGPPSAGPEAPRGELPDAPAPLPEPATVVPEVRRIYADAARIAAGDVSVLITGESGTGKEVLARYLHRASPRRGKPFVALNCAALPRDLLEAELFGIEDGVATGVQQRAGCFERADGGTLFLDEIGDMGAETQARILRVLQEGEVFRLGARAPRSADVRVLAATNRDVDALLADGGFRTDLYHRIADWRVELPPLRHRRGDIVNLAVHFLEAAARKRGVGAAGLSKRAAALLLRYPWPGNVRQLEREIARAVLFLEPGELLQSRHLQEAVRRGPEPGDDGAGRTLRQRLQLAERAALKDEIRRQGGDVRAAAEVLDMGRSTLYRRIRELGLDDDGED